MPSICVPGSVLHYDVVDLTLPWITEPQTILFHHGLGATSGTWAAWLPVLADRYRLVRFDMRGHGRSTFPEAGSSRPARGGTGAELVGRTEPVSTAGSPRPASGSDPSAPSVLGNKRRDSPATEPVVGKGALSLDLLADDVFAVADAAGAQRFHLVGESIGGTIALLAASRRGERVRTLTVSNGAHLGGSIRSIDDWRDIMDAGGMAGWSQHMMPKRFFEGEISEPMWRWYEHAQGSASREFVLEAVRLLAGADLSPELGRLRMPVLLLHGDSSPFIPVSVLADLKSRLADARLQVFHARHGLPFSHAKECAQVLRDFLDAVG